MSRFSSRFSYKDIFFYILARDVRDVSGTKVTGAALRTRSSCIADALAGRATRGIMQMRFGDRRRPRRVKLVAA